MRKQRSLMGGILLLLTAVGLAQSPAVLELRLAEQYQEIDGFGTAIINYKDFPPEYSDPTFVDRVVNDLGLSLLRLPLTEHLEYANDDADPDHFNWAGFHLSDNAPRKGWHNTLTLAARFREAGVERFMLSPWSPPQFMKTNRAPIQGGFLRQDMTQEFAEYLAAAVLLARRNYGIDIGWVSMQNESIFVQFYRSCLYHPQMMREAVRAVMRKFAREGIEAELLLNEDMLFADRIDHGVRPTLEDEETGRFRGNLAVHRKQGREGLLELRERLDTFGRKYWMTETSGHDANWSGAFKLANDMHDYLVYGGFSAWLYWQISGNTGASDPGRYTLMLEGQPTKKYYAAKHYYRYVRPGAVRTAVATTAYPADSLKVAAFTHATDGTLTLVLINNSAAAIPLVVQEAAGAPLPETFAHYLTTEDRDGERQPDWGNGAILALPPQSITTLQGEHPSLRTAEPTRRVTQDVPRDLAASTDPFPARTDWQAAPDGSPALSGRAAAYSTAGAIDSARFNGWTVLHDAALNGDCAALRYALAQQANVNATAADGWTPLHAAAASFVGSKQPVEDAAECTKYTVFRIVLEAGADLSARTTDGLTPLHAAVMNAHTGWRQDEHEALARVNDLLAAGAEVDARDHSGRTPLHWACMQGYTHFTGTLNVEGDVVATLLAYGADSTLRDTFGQRPIDYAEQMGYTEILNVLHGEGRLPTSAEASPTPTGTLGPELLAAAWQGDTEAVKRLLARGADTHYVDSDGFTALERARDNGFTQIVQLIRTYDQAH